MMNKTILLTLVVFLTISTVHAIVIEDPNEAFYKEYLGAEIKVEDHPIYVEEYYITFLTNKLGVEQGIPSIAILTDPVEVRMTAKVPVRSRFYPQLNADGTKKNWKATVTKEEGGFTYLEYTLFELGEWTFFLESDFDVDRYSFILNTVQTTSYGGSGSRRSSDSKSSANEIQIQLCDAVYDVGDIICLEGVDILNPDIQMAYVDPISGKTNPRMNPSDTVYAVANEETLIFRDTTGRKPDLRLDIKVNETGPIAFFKNNLKGVLAVLLIAGLALLYKRGKS